MDAFFAIVGALKVAGLAAAALAFALPVLHLALAALSPRRPLLPILNALSAAAEAVSTVVGRGALALALAMVLVQFAVVVMRYVFGIGSIFLQESIVYMHGMLFLLAAAFTLMRDGHVRVDLVYRTASPRWRAAVNLIGVYLFLLPVMLTIIAAAEPFVAQAWRVLEGSKETSGIPAIFLLKSVIPAFGVLMIVQGLAEAIKAALELTGDRRAQAPALDADERLV